MLVSGKSVYKIPCGRIMGQGQVQKKSLEFCLDMFAPQYF